MTQKNNPTDNKRYIVSVIFILSMLAASAFIAFSGSSDSELSSFKRIEAEQSRKQEQEKQNLVKALTSEIDDERFFFHFKQEDINRTKPFNPEILYVPKKEELGNKVYTAIYCSKSRELENWLGLSSKELFDFYKECYNAKLTLTGAIILPYEEVQYDPEDFVLINKELISRKEGKICSLDVDQIYPFIGQSVQDFYNNRNLCISMLPIKNRFVQSTR